jgi:hypothetical protein
MRQPHLIAVAKFIRDLLVHDEQLIKFDREDIPMNDFNTDYIVVNGSGISNKTSNGSSYNGETEVMSYNDSFSQSITIEFYGDGAYNNSRKLSLLNVSQKATELKKLLTISISHISGAIDVKQILGSAHGNRMHLTFNMNYCPSIDVETLRIDTAQFEFIEDK